MSNTTAGKLQAFDTFKLAWWKSPVQAVSICNVYVFQSASLTAEIMIYVMTTSKHRFVFPINCPVEKIDRIAAL